MTNTHGPLYVMDVYRAIANFTAPSFNSQGKPIHTCLTFKKGDLFEVLESENERTKLKVWWACRTTCEDRKIGYVPAKYLKFHEKRPGKIKDVAVDHHLPVKEDLRRNRDVHGKALADLRQHAGEAPPNDFTVKDPVLSPTSPTAPTSASPCSPMRSAHKPANTGNSKLSPGAIRVPFMVPLLPGSPMANTSPAHSPSREQAAAHSSCNQCFQQNSQVIDLSTAFPAWNAGNQKAVAPIPGSCTHRQQQQPQQKTTLHQYPKSNNNQSAQNSPPSNGSPRKEVFPPGSPELRRNREGLIEPKKLVNPCLESKERQVLHRELLHKSQGQGEMVGMLPKKSELRQVFDKRMEKQREKDKEELKAKKKPEFEKELEEQVEKLQKQFTVADENVYVEEDKPEKDNHDQKDIKNSGRESPAMRVQSSEPEFIRIRAKLTEKAKS